VDIAEELGGIKLNRKYNLDAPRGVAGRNSDNTKLRNYLGWEPEISLKDGMEKTYRWIYDEFTTKYNAKNAHKSAVSIFTHGAKPIPGYGWMEESRTLDTWKKGIPAGYGAPPKANGKAKAGKPKAKAKKASGRKVAKKRPARR